MKKKVDMSQYPTKQDVYDIVNEVVDRVVHGVVNEVVDREVNSLALIVKEGFTHLGQMIEDLHTEMNNKFANVHQRIDDVVLNYAKYKDLDRVEKKLTKRIVVLENK
jgi:hypothetical protein